MHIVGMVSQKLFRKFELYGHWRDVSPFVSRLRVPADFFDNSIINKTY